LNDLGSRTTRMFDKDVDSALTEALKKNGRRNVNIPDPHQYDQRDEEEFDLSQMESEQ
jgi:hypothetical protein